MPSCLTLCAAVHPPWLAIDPLVTLPQGWVGPVDIEGPKFTTFIDLESQRTPTRSSPIPLQLYR